MLARAVQFSMSSEGQPDGVERVAAMRALLFEPCVALHQMKLEAMFAPQAAAWAPGATKAISNTASGKRLSRRIEELLRQVALGLLKNSTCHGKGLLSYLHGVLLESVMEDEDERRASSSGEGMQGKFAGKAVAATGQAMHVLEGGTRVAKESFLQRSADLKLTKDTGPQGKTKQMVEKEAELAATRAAREERTNEMQRQGSTGPRLRKGGRLEGGDGGTEERRHRVAPGGGNALRQKPGNRHRA